MKKKTVITTEKSEVWVIRQAGGEIPEQEIDANESEYSANSLLAPLGTHSETETPPDEQN
jgi:hypothetical protein